MSALRPVGPLRPFAGVEHVRAQVVLVVSVDEFGGVVAGEPAVHALSPTVDPPALLDHRHRAAPDVEHGRGRGFSSRRKLR